jgi:hypothetical protein
MPIVSCPKCREQVLSPESSDPDLAVRCPLCLEEYAMGEILAKLPPALILVGDVAEELKVGGGVAEFEESTSFMSGDRDETESRAAVAAFEFKTSPPPPQPAKKLPRVESSVRPARRRKSVVGEMAKIAAGGVIGIGIAQAILWWGLHLDPLQSGPTVSRALPWIVPEAFWDPTVAAAESSTRLQDPASSQSDLDADPDFTKPARSVAGIVPGGPQQLLYLDEPDPVPAASRDLPTLEQENIAADDEIASSSVAGETEPETKDEIEAEIESENGRTHADKPSPADALPGLDMTPTSVPDVPPALAEIDPVETPVIEQLPSREDLLPTVPNDERLPAVTVVDLAGKLAAARAATEAWDAAGNASKREIRSLAIDFYRSLAELGEAVTAAKPIDGRVQELRQEVGELVSELARDEATVNLVRRVAPQWIATRGPQHGVFLVGNVGTMAKSGSVFEIQLELPTGETVTVTNLLDPSESLQPRTQALVLGFVVENAGGGPTESDHTVVGGFHIVVD